jgi:thioredoxin-like negative regulator of GroEL
MLSPVLDEIAGEYFGRDDVYKVDLDREADLAAAFDIRSIPTMLFVPMNGMPTLAGGVMPKQEIGRMLDQML